MKKCFNNEKGITLVALIVTMLVMIILSGIVVTNVFSGEGLLNKKERIQAGYDEQVSNVQREINSIGNTWQNVIGRTGIENEYGSR